jgi:hypothetical protein
MSALLLKADIGEHHRDVRFVPKADITANRGSGLQSQNGALDFSYTGPSAQGLCNADATPKRGTFL